MRTRTRPAAGFSLLELTIAANEKRNTQNTLAILDAAMKEWERQVDRPVTFQNDANEGGTWDVAFDRDLKEIQPPPDSQKVANGLLPLPYNNDVNARRFVLLLHVMTLQPDVETIIARLPDDVLRRMRKVGTTTQYINLKEVVDAWGNPIRASFPGKQAPSGHPLNLTDADGSIRTVTEQAAGFGVCRNRQVLFVSAGPDGILADNSATASIDESADNLYSYGEEGQ
jgi:hypothetical protein